MIKKSGVLFAQTATGGILMDLSADQFIALSPISSIIWSTFEPDQDNGPVLQAICSAKGISLGEATVLLRAQIEKWTRAGLLISEDIDSNAIPVGRPADLRSREDIAQHDLAAARISIICCVRLMLLESDYRRGVRKMGLAGALVQLQAERTRTSRATEEAFLLTALKSYYFTRRAFKQGKTARDCLYRSMGLSAFLRRHGIENELCIGITGLPFTSHAWVEHRGCVVNETLDRINEYVAIGRF